MTRDQLLKATAQGDAIHAALQDPACPLRDASRVYAHAFTCDKAIAAQVEVDAKPHVEGEQNLNVQGALGSDKTDVNLREGKWPQHLKVTNISLAEWFKRTSKVTCRHIIGICLPFMAICGTVLSRMWHKCGINVAYARCRNRGICLAYPQLMMSMFPTWPEDKERTPVENAEQRHILYQRCMAVLLLCWEECARRGIRVVHRCPPPHLPVAVGGGRRTAVGIHRAPGTRCICQAYAHTGILARGACGR